MMFYSNLFREFWHSRLKISAVMFVYHAAPCSAGDYMTASGCQQCGENSYSGDGASSCTSCPDDKVSAAGSASQDDCEYGKIIGLSIQTIHY